MGLERSLSDVLVWLAQLEKCPVYSLLDAFRAIPIWQVSGDNVCHLPLSLGAINQFACKLKTPI